MTPSLPQHDPTPGPRYRQLATAMDAYSWDYQGPMALLAAVPSEQHFPISYQLKRVYSALKFGANLAAVRASQLVYPHNTIEDYARYFPLMGRKPAVIGKFNKNDVFGWQRYAGANPLDVRCLTEKPDGFPVDDALLSHIAGTSTTIAAEIAERRLFYTDYSHLWDIASAVDARDGDRFFAAAKVMYWQPKGAPLKPVAIQLRPTPADDNPLFTPADGFDWEAAKIYAQSSDTMSHEMTHHLAQCHLILEPVAVAARRRLAANHPIGILLANHLEGLLAINDFGRRTLINPGGFLDALMAGWLRETLTIVTDGVRDYDWTAKSFHNDLKSRGLFEANPSYDLPWRDDGQLVWQAISDFVRDYVGLYYTSPEDVAHDAELQRWLAEMRGPGRMSGLVERFSTVDDVVKIVTRILWISGPKHAAVNYAQWDYVAFVPNMPFALYGEIPSKKRQFNSENELVDILPPRDETLKQVLLMEALTGWQHTRLGEYSADAFTDPKVAPVIQAFRNKLAAAEATIVDRNKARLVPYPYLQPSLIPNSTNT
jgi:arachidonate 15-lipoxygenase